MNYLKSEISTMMEKDHSTGGMGGYDIPACMNRVSPLLYLSLHYFIYPSYKFQKFGHRGHFSLLLAIFFLLNSQFSFQLPDPLFFLSLTYISFLAQSKCVSQTTPDSQTSQMLFIFSSLLVTESNEIEEMVNFLDRREFMHCFDT